MKTKPSKTFINSRKALIYARAFYRDSGIEEYHSMNSYMNMDLYKVMVEECENNMDQYYYLFSRILSGKEQNKILERILFSYMLTEWDDPIQITEKFTNSGSLFHDVAIYVLNEVFIQNCMKENIRLNDSVMKELNKDVYNRFYTLVCKGVI